MTQILHEVQVHELPALGGRADHSAVAEGLTLPEKIKRRKNRLAVMDVAKVKIALRTKVRCEQELTLPLDLVSCRREPSG